MNSTAEFNDVATFESVARPRANRSHAPGTIVAFTSARNDAICTEPAEGVAIYPDENELEAWARHAFGANGFGDAAITRPASSIRSPSLGVTSAELARTARAQHSPDLRTLLFAAWRAAIAAGQRMLARHRQHRQVMETHDALTQLNDDVLRDLGFHRSELMSVATELAGGAERTRVRAFHPL